MYNAYKIATLPKFLYHVVYSIKQIVSSYSLCAISRTESFEIRLLYAFCLKVSLPSKIFLLTEVCVC